MSKSENAIIDQAKLDRALARSSQDRLYSQRMIIERAARAYLDEKQTEESFMYESFTYQEHGYKLSMTCCGYPEQYDVLKDGKKVGYLQLRHGFFSASYPDSDGEKVYETWDCQGSGSFYSDERDYFLNEAVKEIHKRILADDQVEEV